MDEVLVKLGEQYNWTLIYNNPCMLVIGTFFNDIYCETFLDPETGRIRVRPLPDQGLPTKIVIESLKKFREDYPLGTIFRAESLKVCKKSDGRIYLRAKDQMLYDID